MAEVVSLLSFFVSAASAFGKLTSWLVNRRHSERERIAAYFDQVSACLREVAQRIEDGEAPRDTCRRLAVYAQELHHILGDRGYLTAAGDASIDETRLRLAGELEQTQADWAVVRTGGDPVDLAAEALSQDLALAAIGLEHRVDLAAIGVGTDKATVDRVEREVLDRATSSTQEQVQPIWDAAGEFSALADALRAR